MQENSAQKTNGQDLNPVFIIQRIYTKEVSLESPNSPDMLRQKTWDPSTEVQLNSSTNKLADDMYEVMLSITVTTKNQEKVAFLVEIQEAGIFQMSGFPEDQLSRMLGTYCPNIIFPYSRQLISELVSNAGFPPFYLMPINFDALYEQQKKQGKSQSENKIIIEDQAASITTN